jgi:thiopurine S-methyltransferase
LEASFWHEVWEKRQLGFNQSEYNPKMVELLKDKKLEAKTVFVPLCGKSVDMLWLASRGANVYGCELSKLAVEDFFTENNIKFQIEDLGNVTRYSSESITIDCGNFFEIDFPEFDYIYDRASMVALPPEMRLSYQQKMKALLGQVKEYYLFTFSYNQSLFEGPPFSIDEQELVNAFKDSDVSKVFSETKKSDFKGVDLNVTRSVYLIK